MRSAFFLVYIFFCLCTYSQDSVYARRVVKELTSEKYFGRGYTKKGLQKAAGFLVNECKKNKTKPLFGDSYEQFYSHGINTFPGKMLVTLNGVKLMPGKDFIVEPHSSSIKGKYYLRKKDSVTYVSDSDNPKVVLVKKNKLTHSLATTQNKNQLVLYLLSSQVLQESIQVEVNIQAVFLQNFIGSNIACVVEGNNNDSMLVFTAHYDHLGGMGKKCFFPGANDNASGTAMLLDLMRYYTNNKPEYKTVFIFFSGEEAGLLGSAYFVKNPPIDISKIKFLVNLDLLGTGEDGIMVVNGAVFEKQFERLQLVNYEKQYVKEVKKRGKASNSDHYWFSEKGVPCFFIYTLGGVSFYHDIYDRENTLPLTKYNQVFKLITEFVMKL